MTAAAPAGERYYRHPGDLLRLITWAIVAAVLVVFIEVSDATSAGVATDLGRAAARVPEVVREMYLALTQVAAVAVPVVLLVSLLWQRRFRRLG